MEMRVNEMGFQKQKASIVIRGLLYSLIFSASLKLNAQENNDLALNELTEDRSEISHFSRAAKYAQVGYSASINDLWHQAREGWEKAVEHLELTDASDRNRAVFYYEFGHAAGITCDFEVAEEFIEKSYQLEKSINAPSVLTLVEMFRLYFDQKHYRMASIYFEAALPSLIDVNAEANTPAQFSRLLDEYAEALSHLDKHQLANQFKQQSRKIKTRTGRISGHDRRTLYGSRCGGSDKKLPITIAQTTSVSDRMSNIREILKTMNTVKK